MESLRLLLAYFTKHSTFRFHRILENGNLVSLRSVADLGLEQ
jgi:hypothetical protein